ncbi:phosphotransferase [Salinicoccus sesuvii]|uniref:Phosphotransferase n=1 Tax=Salinicoccus sesuvii TaxID=868281 RepID=A0ABV7N3X9_9STAP
MVNQNEGEKLNGGNVSEVYRMGDTVRRELKLGSSKIHELLIHLDKKGFQQAPKFLGIDENGKEILTFFKGEAGNYPLKAYMWSDEVLKEIAKMLRLYHDSVTDFSFDESWQFLDNTPPPYEVICHNDFAIYNIIFNEKQPVGIIDFDNASPGPRLWDIAYTLYTCVPLSRYNLLESSERTVSYNHSKDAERTKRRIKLFFESYGEKVEENFLEMVILRLEGLTKTIVRKAREGDLAFQKMIKEGHVEHYQKEIRFIRKHGREWL